MVTVVLLWSLSVLLMSVLLAVVIAAQSGARAARRVLHALNGRHGAALAAAGSRSTRPGPRRGPGLVIGVHGKS